jgi:hypothetical protein
MAQTLSASPPVKNAGNSGDDFSDGLITSYQNKTTVAIVMSTTTQFRVHYQEIVAADVGVGGSDRTQSQSTDYTINFTANAPGAYRLNVSTSAKGAFTLVDDGDAASVDMTSITGTQSGGTLTGGTLSLSDPGSAVGSGGADIGFERSATAIIANQSNGTAQSHSLRFTWARPARATPASSGGDECALRMGLPATFGNQTAGTYGPGSPGNRPAGPDGHWVTVTLESLCGNGSIDSGSGITTEQCDDGPNNGSSTSCCNTNCTYRGAGQVCRPSAGSCDVQETCSGGSGTCPTNNFVSSGTVCRSSASVCDVAETCTGTNGSCPTDNFFTGSTVCRSAAGGCDVAENCPGGQAACPADARQPSGHVCRSQAGLCDVQEVCNGSSTACPADAVAPTTVTCRGIADLCDIAEKCDGVNKACPADGAQPLGHVCRSASGVCDQAETCNGVNITCPPDAFLGSTSGAFVCRSQNGICDVQEVCDGSGPNCLADAKVPSGTICRTAAGACDIAETCNGIANTCPSDSLQASGFTCRSSSGIWASPSCKRQRPLHDGFNRARPSAVRQPASVTSPRTAPGAAPLSGDGKARHRVVQRRARATDRELQRRGQPLPRRSAVAERHGLPLGERRVRCGRGLHRLERRVSGRRRRPGRYHLPLVGRRL